MILSLLGTLLAVSGTALSDQDAVVARFPVAVRAFEEAPFRTLSKRQARLLLDSPVRLGSADRGVHYIKYKAPDRTVVTCRDRALALRDGYRHGETHFDNAMNSFLVSACGLLDAVLVSEPVRASSIERPRRTLSDIDELSAAVLPQRSLGDPRETIAQREIRGRQSIGDLVRQKACNVKARSLLRLVLVCGGLQIDLVEVFRTALDKRGEEVIIIDRAEYVAGFKGTFAAYDPLFALKRRAPPRPLLWPVTLPAPTY